MERNLKILSAIVVIVILAVVGWVVLDSMSKERPCIEQVNYSDGDYMSYHAQAYELMDMGVVFYYDNKAVSGQKIVLEGGPDIRVSYRGEYIGTMHATDRSFEIAVGKGGYGYHIYYDVTTIGLKTTITHGVYEYNGKIINILDMDLVAEKKVPQSWEKWMVEGYKVITET